MKSIVRAVFASLSRGTFLMAIATMTPFLAPSAAGAVEYVKVCSLYGAGFYYIPGTDTCVDIAQHDARVATEGGVWRYRYPSNPLQWVASPEDACPTGVLEKFGVIDNSGLFLDNYDRYETFEQLPANKPGQYISAVIYQGGFTGPNDDTDSSALGSGNFCMFYYYNDPTNGPQYTPIGCLDTAPIAAMSGGAAFSPDMPVPPSTTNPVFILGANGPLWKIPGNSQTPPRASVPIQGSLSVWLCLQSGNPASFRTIH
jgi:hypothetical protein